MSCRVVGWDRSCAWDHWGACAGWAVIMVMINKTALLEKQSKDDSLSPLLRVSIRAQNWSANDCSHFRRGCERIVRIFALFWSANKANNDIKWVELLVQGQNGCEFHS